MRFSIVGFGRIGGGLARLALAKGQRVVVYNWSAEATRTLVKEVGVPLVH